MPCSPQSSPFWQPSFRCSSGSSAAMSPMKTTPTPSTPKSANKSPKKSSAMMKLLPIALSMLIWTSCAHYKVIDADKTVRRLKAHETFLAPSDGWFVPDARWLELREAISDKIEGLEKQK